MVVGVLGAIAQDDVKRILSFNIVSHIGYMVMGLGLFTVAGLAAAVFYIVHHIVAKTALFLTGGLIEHVGGSGRLSRLGGMVRTAPVRGRAVPRAGAEPRRHPAAVGLRRQARRSSTPASADTRYVLVGVASLVSLLTLFSMMKIWSGVFWSPAHRAAREPAARPSAGWAARC